MRFFSRLILLTIATLALLTTCAHAAPQCGPHDAVAASLAEQYGETPQAMGRDQGGAVMELYAGPRGTWTITITLPDGKTCLVASGGDFVAVKPTPTGEPT